MKISMEEVDRILRMRGMPHTGGNGANGHGNGNGNGKKTDTAHLPATAFEITGRAQDVNLVKRLVEEMPDVREDLVEAMQARLAARSYKVDTEQVADLMLRRTLADRIG